MTTKSRRRVAVGAAVVGMSAIGPSVAQASVSIVDEEIPVVTVVDEGDPNHRVVVGGPAEPGTLADSTTNYDVAMSVEGQGFPIALDLAAVADMTRITEVLTVESDGAFTARETFTSFNLATSSAGSTDPEELGVGGSATTDFAPLVDVPLIVSYGAAGNMLGAEVEAGTATTPDQDALAGELVESGFGTEPFTASLPPTPVGQGAVWTVAESDSSASTVVPLTMRFTLVSLKGDDYTIEIGLEGDVLGQLEADSPGTEVMGEMTLTGTLTGNAANGLDQQLSMDLLIDVTVTEDDVSIDLDAELSIDHTSTPR